MKRFAALLPLCFLLLPLWGQDVDSNAGQYGIQVLKLNSSLVTAGSGGTCALYTDDGFGFLANPTAGLFSRTRSVSINTQSWLFDTRMTMVGLSSTSGRHSSGVALRNLDYGSFEMRDEQGDYTGDYHPLDVNLIANYAYRILPDMFFGVNLGGLYEEINTASAYGVTSDIGTAWQSPIDGMTISGSVKYIGKTTKMHSKSIKLPTTAELAVTQNYETGNFDMTGECKLQKPVDDNQLQVAFGMNASYHKLLSLRLGYKINFDNEAFSAGIGVNYHKITVDYAYLPFKNDLDDVHMIGMTYHY